MESHRQKAQRFRVHRGTMVQGSIPFYCHLNETPFVIQNDIITCKARCSSFFSAKSFFHHFVVRSMSKIIISSYETSFTSVKHVTLFFSLSLFSSFRITKPLFGLKCNGYLFSKRRQLDTKLTPN